MDRNNLIDRLVKCKMNRAGHHKTFCICICNASVSGAVQQRPAPASPVK